MSYTDQQRANDYKTVFGSPIGKKVLTDILMKANLFSPIQPTDPVVAARMEGARHLALHIASFIRFDANEFVQSWKQTEEVLND